MGSLSNTLTVTPVWVSNSSAAYMPAGPEPTTATLRPGRSIRGAGATGANRAVSGGFSPAGRGG